MKRSQLFVLAAVLSCTACSSHTESSAVKPVTAQVGGRPPYVQPVIREAHDAPLIISMWISKDRFGSGDTVSGRLVTSTNVASAEARVGGYGIALHRDRYGVFSLTYHVPELPSFVKRDFDLELTARNAAGEVAHADLPIHVR